MVEVRVLQADPVREQECRQEHAFAQEQESPALAYERADFRAPEVRGARAHGEHQGERTSDDGALEVEDAEARRFVDQVRQAEDAERLRQQETAVGQAAEADDGERHEREGRQLHR